MCLAKRFKVKPREVLRNLAYSAIWRTPQSGVLRNPVHPGMPVGMAHRPQPAIT